MLSIDSVFNAGEAMAIRVPAQPFPFALAHVLSTCSAENEFLQKSISPNGEGVRLQRFQYLDIFRYIFCARCRTLLLTRILFISKARH